MTVNILTLPDSEHRRERLYPQLKRENIAFQYHNGVVDKMMPFRGIAQSHKNIIRKAKQKNEPMCCVMEDDCTFTAPGGWKHFLDNIPKTDFDIYLGGVSNGLLNEDNSVTDFRGLFLYIMHERFYDTFLGLDDRQNIDAGLTNKGKFYVCNPFAVIHADGFSYHQNKNKTYGHLWEGRQLFGQ